MRITYNDDDTITISEEGNASFTIKEDDRATLLEALSEDRQSKTRGGILSTDDFNAELVQAMIDTLTTHGYNVAYEEKFDCITYHKR